VPAGVGDEADDAIRLASGYGLLPDEWQRTVLEGWLGVRRNGKWSAPRCGLAVPRQNGKNAILEIRELYGMVLLGEKFLHTAHEVKTARKAFLRLLHFFDNPRKFPELHDRVREIRRTNGQEAIFLHNGGSVEFVARSKGSGRGFTVDVLVCDEAQELSDDTNAALLPTISAAPLGNPQTILTGTPPSPTMNGEVFTRRRKAGLAGKDTRLCWHEWSCEPGTDPDDREGWARANPALGVRLTVETIADERAEMDDETFLRERDGVWDDDDLANQFVIPLKVWADLADRSADPEPHVGKVALAIDTDPSRGRTSIVAAGLRADGLPMVELIENLPGVEWAPSYLAELYARNQVCAVVIDKRSAAASLIQALTDTKLPILTTDAAQMAQACGQFYDATVETGRLRHVDQQEMNDALKAAVTRPLGDAWAWDRKRPTADITPITAATLALWGFTVASTPPKNAGRGRVIALN
jgi:phage terminase large subunit-like protein